MKHRLWKIKEEIKEPENKEEPKEEVEDLPTFLPQTGEKILNVILISTSIIISAYYSIKVRKYK